MGNDIYRTGRAGEYLACEYLTKLGHRIIDRNCRISHLELDIVSIKGNAVHFVEVKSRKAPLSADPQDNINAVKWKRVCAAAAGYLKRGRLAQLGISGADFEIDFDVITVVFDGEKTTVEYYPKAFIPIYV